MPAEQRGAWLHIPAASPVMSAAWGLLLIALAILPEGAALPAYGGAVWLLAALSVPALWLPPVRRAGTVWLLAVLLLLLYHTLPVPPLLRGLLAPGQAAAIAAVAPEDPSMLPVWLDRLARYDLDAAIGTAGLWEAVRYGVAPGWSPGGVHMAGAAWWAAKAGGLLVLAGLGWRISASQRAVRVLLVGMLLAGVAEAVFGLANRSGPSTGIGEKVAYLGSATGTFINRSHFSAFLVMGLGCAWGLAASLFPLIPEEVRRHRQRKKRSSQPPGLLSVAGDKIPRLVLLGFVTAILSVGLIMSKGRGPLIGLAVAGVAVGLLHWLRRRDPLHIGMAVAIPGCGVLLSVLAFGVRGSVGRFMQVLWEDDSVLSRFQVWRESLLALRDAPLLGHGPSAFQTAWALHHAGPYLYDFPFAHNGLIQIAVEGGLAGLALALAGLAALLWSVRRLPDAPPEIVGVSAGCVAVLLQSLADFPLHIPGVAVPFALLTGLCVGACHRVPARAVQAEAGADPAATISGEGAAPPDPPAAPAAPGTPETPADPPRLVAVRRVRRTMQPAWIGLAAVTAIASLLSIYLDLQHPGTRTQRLGSVPAIWYRAAASATFSAADPAQGGWLAEATAESRRQPLDPWLHLTVARGHALMARQTDPEAHVFAADQAISRALWLRPRDPRLLIAAAELLLRLARSVPMRDAFRARAADLLGQAVAIDGWRAEDAFSVAAGLSNEMLARIAAAAGEDARASARVRYAYAQELSRRKDFPAALAAAQQAVQEDPGFGPGWFRLGEYALRLKQEPEALAAFQRFLATDDRPLAMEGWAWYHLDRHEEAITRFRKAVAADPSNRWAWDGIVVISRARDDRRNELGALRRILKMEPGNEKIRQRIDELEGK